VTISALTTSAVYDTAQLYGGAQGLRPAHNILYELRHARYNMRVNYYSIVYTLADFERFSLQSDKLKQPCKLKVLSCNRVVCLQLTTKGVAPPSLAWRRKLNLPVSLLKEFSVTVSEAFKMVSSPDAQLHNYGFAWIVGVHRLT
jgi:hypothetical protein